MRTLAGGNERKSRDGTLQSRGQFGFLASPQCGGSDAAWPIQRTALCSIAFQGGHTMPEAKLAPNLPDWQVQHANRYLASGGSEGHMYKIDVPGRGEITAPALLLTTTGRKSGDKFIFPLFYGTDGGSYIIVASKGGAPEHPGWYRDRKSVV